jgi:tetratricopeptide (TPR) repeat protein
MTHGNGNKGAAGAARDPETDRARLRAIHAAMTGGDIAGAALQAEDALADGLDHVLVLSLVAGRREDEGRLDEALKLLKRAKRAAPEAPGIRNQVGLCLARMERWQEAAGEYDAALAQDSRFAPALGNRAAVMMALGRTGEARRDFEAAAALDPGNLAVLNGLAALALGRGEPAEARRLSEAVLAREPGFPGAVLTLAGADLQEGRAAEAEAGLRPLLGDPRVGLIDRVIAWGMLGDALDAERRFAEAFGAWSESNALQELHYRPAGGGGRTLALMRAIAVRLEGMRIPATWGRGGQSPAAGHVFVVGFPRSQGGLAAPLFEGNAEIATLVDKMCLIDAAREWLADAERFDALLAASDDALEPSRAAYWRRVAAEGADPVGRVLVDLNPLNIFRLPLIARLFPEARVVVARRDPRDLLLDGFRHRFEMGDLAYQLLTPAGVADLYEATMAMMRSCEAAFGLYLHDLPVEALTPGEVKALSDFIGVDLDGAPAIGEAPGKWRDYEAELGPALDAVARVDKAAAAT